MYSQTPEKPSCKLAISSQVLWAVYRLLSLKVGLDRPSLGNALKLSVLLAKCSDLEREYSAKK